MLITTKAGNNGKVHIYADGEYRLTVDMGYWLTLGIGEKTELDEAEYEAVERLIGVRRAYAKGLSLLVTREHSRAEIERKLIEKGFGEYAGQAAQQLVDSGYINEERFSELYIRQLIEKKHMSRNGIMQQLRIKGIERELAQSVLDSFDFQPVDDIQTLLNGKFSRYMNDEKGINRCFNSLARLGYSPSDIRRAFAVYKQEANDG